MKLETAILIAANRYLFFKMMVPNDLNQKSSI